MAQNETTGWCDVCKARRKLQRPAINHVLHLLLSICTCGIWLLVWLNKATDRRRRFAWRCSSCGSDNVFPGEKKVAEGIAYYKQEQEETRELDTSLPAGFCIKCGALLQAGAAFCARCGSPVSTAASTPAE